MEEENVVKISELQPVDDLYDGCCMPVVQYNETRKVEYATLRNKLKNEIGDPFSGDYKDLKNTPTIPTKTSQLKNDSGYLTGNLNDYAKKTDLPKKVSDLENDENYIKDTDYQEDIDNINNNIDTLKNEVLDTGEASDTFIHVEDSSMSELQELSVEGVCEQETTEGKNLFDKDLFETFTNEIKTIELTLKPNTNYTMSSNLPLNNGNASIFFKLPNESFDSVINGITPIRPKMLLTDEKGIVNIGYRNTNNALTGDLKNDYFYMLNEGITALDYEPYTGEQPSPNPDYPQEIKTITGNLKLTSCGKNLFDKDNVVDGYRIGNNGLPFNDPNSVLSQYIKVKPNTTYYTNFQLIWTNCICEYTKDKIFILRNQSGLNEFTTSNNCEYIRITCFKTQKGELQLEQGSAATPYEQHLETQITANLGNEFIAKFNDTYKDTLNVKYNEDDDKYHLILNKNIGKVVLDGNENWNILESAENQIKTIYFTTNVFDNVDSPTYIVKSNYFAFNNWLWDDDTEGIFLDIDNKPNLRLRINKTTASTVTECKQWLSTHNTEVYYVLATPYKVDLGVVDMPLSYDEVTNIFTDNDLLPKINGKYYRNFISTIRNLQVNNDTLKNELVNIENRLSALESASASVVSESEVQDDI